MIFATTLFFTSLFGLVCFSAADKDRDSIALHRDLFKDYSRTARPVLKDNSPVNVTYGASLYQILGFDVDKETVTTLIWQRVFWTDENLRWNPANYSGVTTIRVYQDEIWLPDLTPYNDIGVYDVTRFKNVIPIQVSSEGEMTWLLPVQLVTTCSMDVKHFPFDEQQCEIDIGSWQYAVNELDIHCMSPEGLDLKPYTEHSIWRLKGPIFNITHKVSDTQKSFA